MAHTLLMANSGGQVRALQGGKKTGGEAQAHIGTVFCPFITSQAECLITDTGLRILADSCRHLADLHLYCPHVLGLEFDRGFEMLVGLSLSAARLSDAGMHQISMGCPKLKRLAVRRCKQVSSLFTHSNQAPPSLPLFVPL